MCTFHLVYQHNYTFHRLQAPLITECDLSVDLGIVKRGPVRLATQPPQLTNPLPGFEAIVHSQPFLSLSGLASSSEVFVVDGVVVIFAGYSSGQVRKVFTVLFERKIYIPSLTAFRVYLFCISSVCNKALLRREHQPSPRAHLVPVL